MTTMRATFTGFDPYKLTGVKVTDRKLGHGSYATVLELKYMGLKCAGKKIHDVLLEQGGASYTVRRFEEECRILCQVRHPNIVQFLGVCFQQGVQAPILVMEFLPTNLTSCIEQYGILPMEISYSILLDVAVGLCYLHGQTPPIIHRDLSSNNVLLNPNMTAKISDLGVARILNLTLPQVSHMTQTPGTPAYMPPEVMIANPKYDSSVDEFSYGILMIHMFCGKWPEQQIGQIRTEHDGRLIPVTEAERREEFLRSIGSDHPLMNLILKCINNHPKSRAHAIEIVERLEEMVLQFPTSFDNRLDALRRIEAVTKENSDLREEKLALREDIEREIHELRTENELLKIKNKDAELNLQDISPSEVHSNSRRLPPSSIVSKGKLPTPHEVQLQLSKVPPPVPASLSSAPAPPLPPKPKRVPGVSRSSQSGLITGNVPDTGSVNNHNCIASSLPKTLEPYVDIDSRPPAPLPPEFYESMTVHDAYRLIQERVPDTAQEQPGLFSSDKDQMNKCSSEQERTPQYCDVKSGDELQYRKKLSPLRVKILDGSTKTLLVDNSQTVAELIKAVCATIGLSNPEEFFFTSEARDHKRLGTLKKNLHSNEFNWLNPDKSLNEQGIGDTVVLTLRKKLFPDQNIDCNDPVQLNLLYRHSRDAIIEGSHPCTRDEAVQFAAIQCQIQYGNHNKAKHKPGFLMLKEFLPREYVKIKGIEKAILADHHRLHNLNEINAKFRYIQLYRSLRTYGATFFLVKEKMHGRSKLVPSLLGITPESIMRVDENTKEVLKTWPLSTVRRWAASPHTFTLDFGDYSESFYSIQTTEGETISQLIANYIDVVMQKKQPIHRKVPDHED